ncbi:MAG: hypothetical protein WCK42_09445, partial [Myxococcaceae bacterium]
TADIESDLASWTYVLFNWIHMARYKEVRRLLQRCPKLLFCRCEGYFLVHILIAAFTFERKFSIEEAELSELFADVLRGEPDLARLENKDRKTAFDMAMSENMPHVVKLLMLHGNLPLNVILEYQKRRDFSPELRRTLDEFFHPIRHLVPLEDIRRVDIIQGFENEFRSLQGYEASAWRQMHSILEEQEAAILAQREKAELARTAQEEEVSAQVERENKIATNNLKLKEEARLRAEEKEKKKNRLLFAKSQRARETDEMLNEDLRASQIAEKEKQEQEAKQELVRLSRLGEEQIQEVLEATRNIEELFGASDMFRAVYQNNAWAIEGLFQRRDVDRYERFQGRTALGLAILREESSSMIRPLLFALSGKARSHARILLTRSCALDNGTEYPPVFYAVKNKKLHSLKILLEIMKKLQIKPEQNLLDFATALFEKAKKGTDGYKILKMIKEWSESNGV